MKKLKFGLLFCFVLFIFGCKSTPKPETTKVKPLDLLDFSNDFYLSVPSNVDKALLERLVQENFKGVSTKDTKSILDRINRMYIGLTRNHKSTVIQASADVNVPIKFLPSVLSKKKGWTSTPVNLTNPSSTYTVYSQDAISVSFPDSNVACFGNNMNFMLSKYHEIFNTPENLSSNSKFSVLPQDLYTWLENGPDEIRFFTYDPRYYLTMLIGMDINLQLTKVWGAIKPDTEHEDIMLLDLNFEFKNEALMKAGKALLLFTFGLTYPVSDSSSKNALSISGIQLPKEQIYSILVL